MRRRSFRPIHFGMLVATLLTQIALAQDASTGAIRGMVEDLSGARIVGAQVVASNEANGLDRRTLTDGKGNFATQLLTPGEYTVRVASPRMQTELQHAIRVEIGTATEVLFQLRVAENKESVIVTGEARAVETQGNGVSNLIDTRAIAELPLGTRRFTDLALLTPGVTQDPRGLTSGSNGDLAFGGIRGFQTSFLVDGGDNNNAFFAQARGRYRAPYQFSNEVVQEFRVASNSYGAEHGRAGGAVINVVTKSGENHVHGNGFYYLRDSALNAEPAGVNFQPTDRQHQGGFTLGGPLRRNRIFFFSGFDQHVFFVPTLVRFDNGSPVVIPQAGVGHLYHGDYEDSDKDLVFATAAQLSTRGGNYQSKLLGNTGFLKSDFSLNSKNYLSLRLSTSRYWGTTTYSSIRPAPLQILASTKMARSPCRPGQPPSP
jgi:Carboxypeptidase regulatory-like domain